MPRYRFSEFTLSTRERRLLRQGQPLPLIPRYLDLLIFLLERRHHAVHRREIFDHVWTDAIVSDSALSQAIRTLRRTLGDDPREPRFIRTVSRHGYQFTFPDVAELADDELPERLAPMVAATETPDADLLDRALSDEQTRQKIGASLATVVPVAARASASTGVAGALAGAAGGVLLRMAPGSAAPLAVLPVLALAGAAAGAVGGFGVGAGIALAESSSRLRNPIGLTLAAAAGGASAGLAVQWLLRWTLAAVVGVHVPIGGALEGLVIGAAAGIGFSSVRRLGVAPKSRITMATVLAGFCALAALTLASIDLPLVGGTLHLIAREARGAQISLSPLGRLIGEPDFGPLSQSLIAAWEGGVFGLGLGLALLRARSQTDLTELSPSAQDSRIA